MGKGKAKGKGKGKDAGGKQRGGNVSNDGGPNPAQLTSYIKNACWAANKRFEI